MCGIIAYVGRKAAQPLLVEGLKRLEYRGDDSAGIAVLDDKGGLHVRRGGGGVSGLGEAPARGAVGRISVLEEHLSRGEGALPEGARIGMAHTRWATHGAPTEANAHPHRDDAGRIAIVHNGIIENYAALKQLLTDKGHRFVSQTD